MHQKTKDKFRDKFRKKNAIIQEENGSLATSNRENTQKPQSNDICTKSQKTIASR